LNLTDDLNCFWLTGPSRLTQNLDRIFSWLELASLPPRKKFRMLSDKFL